jgi:tetratricopeptide (TPR) repeat protein
MAKMKFYLFLVLCTCMQSFQVPVRIDIYNALIKNRMSDWKKIIDELHSQEHKNKGQVLELINYEYGYIGWCLENNRKDQAVIYIERGERNIEELEMSGFELSYVNSYRSAYYGFRIRINKLQGPRLGPLSIDCAKRAISLDPENPCGYIQYGNAMYFMPRIFGGSKTVALEYYEKAQKMMELRAGGIKYDWNYLNLLVTIAKVYRENGQKKAAKVMYEKILQTEPSFTWVRDELYPGLLKEMN